MKLSLSIAVTLIATVATAAIVDRRPLAEPVATTGALGGGRIVAGGHGDFLLQSRRVSSEGVLLDAEAIPGALGFAVAWEDGWLLMPSAASPFIRKLTAGGEIEPLMQILHRGQFLTATSGHGRFALLEISHPQRLWITIGDERGLIEQREITRTDAAAIAPLGDGFLLVTAVRATQQHSVVHAWRLDRNGIPQEVEQIGLASAFPRLELVARGDRALVTYNFYDPAAASSPWRIAVQTIDPSLRASPVEYISTPPGTDLSVRAIAALHDRFAVSYSLRSGGTEEHRALIVDRDGNRIWDDRAEPIAGVDHFGNRFLIVRPWGDAAIAEEDPWRIVSTPFRLQQTSFAQITTLRTVISGDVTLVLVNDPTPRFVRVDANGQPIDPATQPYASDFGVFRAVTADPEGFSFLSRELQTVEQETLYLSRLARRGSWLTPAPVPLETTTGRLQRVVMHANANDLLVVWTTSSELLWQRFGFDGAPLDPSPRRTAFSNGQNLLGVSGHGDDRLIMLQSVFICQVLCPPVEQTLHVWAIGAEGAPLGERTTLLAESSLRAVALPDRTWIVPATTRAGSGVLHLNRDGSLIGEIHHPLLGPAQDLEPTPLGWRAIMTGRLVEFIGADRPAGVVGLGTVERPQFGYGDLLAFIDAHPSGRGRVPWIGRLESRPGDLSIRVTEITAAGLPRRFDIEVTNHGPGTATNVYVTATPPFTFSLSGSSTARLPALQAGQTVRLAGAYHASFSRDVRVYVLSEDIQDIRPEDNVVDIPWQTPPPSTRRRLVGAASGAGEAAESLRN
jgi:hypothetical protein